MRIRKHFPSSSSSLSSLPLSDPQLISRSPSLVVVVQPQYPHHHHLNNDSNNNNLHEEPKSKINPDHRLSSDPHHHQPLIHHNHTAATSQQTVIIGTENPALVACARNNSNINQQRLEHKEIIKDEKWKTEEEMKISNDNDIRKDISSIAEVDVQFPQSSSSSCQDKWGEEDRIVPPKKRKGSFARTMGTTSKEMIKPKMKSKTNKKCLQQNSDQKKETHCKEGADTSTGTIAVDTKNTTKKSKRGSVIMEGSRCSRVNGRGWRCCQLTLVGYSLCEHHLGKGRLRSMTSVRNRASNIAMARHSTASNITSSTPPTSSSTAAAQQQQNDHSQTPEKQEIIVTTKSVQTWKTSDDDDDDDDDDDYKNNNNNTINIVAAEEEDEMKKPLIRISRKKRKIMKIGSVKARSISSLLGQTDNAGAGAANRNKNSTG